MIHETQYANAPRSCRSSPPRSHDHDRHPRAARLWPVCCALVITCVASTASASHPQNLEELLTTPVPGASPYDVIMAEPVLGASRYEQRQSEIAAAATVISREEIRSFGWRTLDEALASLPGIYKTYDRQYSYLGVRGFGLPGDYTTRILLTIDGMRANEPLYDSAPLGRTAPLDMDLVERIEFIPGPGGAIYGQNAMFGVINVVTRKGATIDGGEFSLAWQSPQTTREIRLSWGKRLENDVDLVVSASALRSDGDDLALVFDDGERGIARGLDGERDQEFALKASRGPWTFGLTHGDRRKDDPLATYGTDRFTPGSYESDLYTLAHLDYRSALADRLSLSARVFAGSYRYESTLIYDGLPYNYPAAADWQGAELQLLSTAFKAHTLMLGVDYQRNSRIDQNIVDYTDPASDYNWKDRHDGYSFGIYMQDQWQISDGIEATLGLRADRNDRTGTKFSPRLGLIWAASSQTALKLMYGRAHRAPNAYQTSYTEPGYLMPNPGLDGEVVDTVELSIDHRVHHNLHLRASIYQWEIDDLIALTTDDSGLGRYQSAGSVTSRGLELSAEHAWRGGARLRGSTSFQHATDEQGTRVENSPRILGRLNFSAPLPGTPLRTGIELAYDGERRSAAGNKVADHWLANLHVVADRWIPGVELSLSLLNLFDEDYAHPSAGGRTHALDSIDQDGRSIRLKLVHRF